MKANELGVEVGAIFDHEWGYDQTNVDFYEVVATTPKTVKIRKVAQVTSEDGFMSGHTVPVPGKFVGPEMRKTVKVSTWNGDKLYLPFDYGWCDLWNGNTRACSWYA